MESPVKPADRWITLLLAAAGISTCLMGVGGFVWTVFSNNLPWSPGTTARDYYLEMGKTYSQGFIMGFFLCFFLALLAVGLAAWTRQHRPIRENAASPQQLPLT